MDDLPRLPICPAHKLVPSEHRWFPWECERCGQVFEAAGSALKPDQRPCDT